MNPEYKLIIENLISLIKDYGGKIFVNDFANSFGGQTPKVRAVITELMIEDLHLIRENENYYHLTNEGWLFKTFEEREKDESSQRKLNQLELNNASFQYKSRFWPHFIALLALLISIISLIFGSDEKIVNKKIETLEKRIQELENKIDKP